MAKKQDWYDFTGQIVGCYTVIEKTEADSAGSMHWRCKCNVCGEISTNLRSNDLNGSSKNTKNCSKSCAVRQKAKEYIGKKYYMLTVVDINEEMTAKWKTVYVNTVCNCGAPKIAKLTDLNCKDKNWACSNKCAKTAENKQLIGFRTGKLEVVGFRHGKVNVYDKDHDRLLFDVKCDCGTNTSYYKRHILGEGLYKQFTSCGCDKQEKMQKFNKKKWEGHIPIPQERASVEYFAWRKAIYKRYEATCARCSSQKRKGMEAHHLFGFSFFKHMRFDENNGILLCKKCHSDFHKLFGNHNNIPQQMLMFMKSDSLPRIDLDRLIRDEELLSNESIC